MKGLAAMKTGKAEGKPQAAPASPEDMALGEAFDAYKDGDRAGFIEAMRVAIRACAGTYAEDDEGEEV